MSISRAEWADWLRSPVTEAVVAKLNEKRDDLIGQLLNMSGESVEAFGLMHLALRNQLNGLGEFLDLDGLEDWICED